MSEQLTDCVWWFARNGISCSYFIPSKAWQVNLEALQTNFELVSPQRYPPPNLSPLVHGVLESPVLTHPWIQGWSEPAAINAPVEDEAVQALPLPREFSAPLSAPKFSPPTYLTPLLSTSPLLPPPSYLPQLISCSLHLQRSVEHRALQHKAWGRWRAQRWRNGERKRWEERFIPNVEAREER